MFDALTTQFLRSAPPLPELDPVDIPQLLTRHYAQLVATRLRGDVEDEVLEVSLSTWPLERIADAYEIVASLEERAPLRRAASFVAATAHQIMSRRQIAIEGKSTSFSALDRDSVDPALAAALLFLAAEQYADANEAALSIPRSRGSSEVRALSRNVQDLARGKLEAIGERSSQRRDEPRLRRSIQNRALVALTSALNEGIELLAASLLDADQPDDFEFRFGSAQEAFRTVLEFSSHSDSRHRESFGTKLITAYAGPRHIAALLLNVADGIQNAALTRIPPPKGADGGFWRKWLRFRASETPYLWRNHREAIDLGFIETGVSSVLVLPTGAGKTTVSALKIAGTLARGKKVIFLAPTHALVEQLTDDLQSMFPSDTFGLQVSNEFDSLFIEDSSLKDIEVMTPERCLAMMSFEPASFTNVGLLVFDECHLLSPESGKLGRALDGMLCVLTFNTIVKDADFLFLSAMLKNGSEFAEWIESLTARKCVSVELLWKPSRQARGVVVYRKAEVQLALQSARRSQQTLDQAQGKRAKSLRAAAQKELKAIPHALWGLTHNWISTPDGHTFTALAGSSFPLTGGYAGGRLWANPNANKTAGSLAISAASSGIKTIIFVNTKADAVNVAREISTQLGDIVSINEREAKIWEALVTELGDAKHAIYGGTNLAAVPHNSSMMRLERLLSESLFRRPDGAKVIVATPTLAQGLNLPAQFAILAGDKRAGDARTPRESLQAHELLNAAARAGRAGHLANGVVLLIPEPLATYSDSDLLDGDLQAKLTSILPEDDRCVAIRDPLEIVLDRISAGDSSDRAVQYTISRLAIIEASDENSATSVRLLGRSYGAFLASRREKRSEFDSKVEKLRVETRKAAAEGDAAIVLIASQSGLPVSLVTGLSNRLLIEIGDLPTSILDWTKWVIDWLSEDELARSHLLHDVRAQLLSCLGRKKIDPIDKAVLAGIFPGLKGWLEGLPLAEIETLLGGEPNSETITKRVCPRARDLISSVVPRGFSFILGLVSHVIDQHDICSQQISLDRTLIQSLASAIRKGYDSVAKLQYANEHRSILSRVEIHIAYRESIVNLFDDNSDLI